MDLYGEHESAEATSTIDDDRDFRLTKYRTNSGALLSHNRAISLLSEACALLPIDPFAPLQKLRYEINGFGTAWTATVLIPMIAGLPPPRKFVGEVMKLKAAAKQSAAFQVCVALHKAGGLDDHLLPPRVARGAEGRDADGGKVDPARIPSIVMTRAENVFGNVWSASSPLYLVVLELDDGIAKLAFGLVTAAPLDLFDGAKLYPKNARPETSLRITSREQLPLDGAQRLSTGASFLPPKTFSSC